MSFFIKINFNKLDTQTGTFRNSSRSEERTDFVFRSEKSENGLVKSILFAMPKQCCFAERKFEVSSKHSITLHRHAHVRLAKLVIVHRHAHVRLAKLVIVVGRVAKK
jgi:hypothetical protein